MKSRIAPIDGLRACAVLGVMWAHAWMFFGNPAFRFGPVDINKLISFGGIGVDLFFVISGFCMYLMYQKKTAHFTLGAYGEFLLKRWKRIAPAFYVIVIIECFIILWRNGYFPFKGLLAHLFFVNTFMTDNPLSPPFWSLSTEWQFYLILPFLFLNDLTGHKRVFRIIILMVVCFLFRIVLFYQHMDQLISGQTLESDKIWYRFIEFGWGILAARRYIAGILLPKWLLGFWGFAVAFCIAYAGRLIMVTEVVNHFHSASFILRALGEPLLTLGFAIMILNVVESKSIFNAVLSTKLMQFIGRISYSMYLWHWIILWNICEWWILRFKISNISLNVAYIITLVVLIPVSWISYRLFEAPYFRTSKNESRSVLVKKLA